jgi:hypothetical protein
MDRQAIQDRARRVRQIERHTTLEWPPDPKKMTHAITELLALADAPQDRVQREARERFVVVCRAYQSRDLRVNDELAAAVGNAWHLFEMMWRDERGRMIPPDTLTRNWKERRLA